MASKANANIKWHVESAILEYRYMKMLYLQPLETKVIDS